MTDDPQIPHTTREVFTARRKFLDRTPEQVAAAADISVAAYRDWERGLINFDDVEVLAWIEAAIERDPARTAREKISVVPARVSQLASLK